METEEVRQVGPLVGGGEEWPGMTGEGAGVLVT